MKPSFVIGKAAVYDDFLGQDLAHELWGTMSLIPYSWSDSRVWTKVWTLADGAILRSAQWNASAPFWQLKLPQGPNSQNEYPPAPFSQFLSRLREVLAAKDDMLEVKSIAMIPYVWPPKSSISWHNDGDATNPSRIGAFSYYVHKHWNAEWGGEFLLTDIDSEFPQSPFDNTEISEAIVSRGYGFWASPKPNRLVINPSSMYHKVAKTTDAAAPRMSIQGFLYST